MAALQVCRIPVSGLRLLPHHFQVARTRKEMIEETKPGNRPSASKPPYAWRVLIIYSLFGPPLGIVPLILFVIVEFHVVASEPLPPSNQFFIPNQRQFCLPPLSGRVGVGLYFLPKSAGISPHCFVSHFIIGVVTLCVCSQCSARAMT